MARWEERAAEADPLGRQVGTPDADRRLLALLLDRQDTAVSQAAADAVLGQDDVNGASALCHRLWPGGRRHPQQAG